jgi:hypothetical protein
MEEVEIKLHAFWIWELGGMSDHLHAPAALTPVPFIFTVYK